MRWHVYSVNSIISDLFSIFKRTRQGSPLSPLLFALAIEPFTAQLREDDLVSGLHLGQLEECVSLYADDIVFTGPGPFPVSDLCSDSKVWRFSGFCITWSKSSMFTMDDITGIPEDCTIPLSTSFRYLGVQVQLPVSRFLDNNLYPVVTAFREKVPGWPALPLTLTGHIHLFIINVLNNFSP